MKRLALIASVMALVVVAVALGGCAQVATEADDFDPPVSLRPVDGTDLKEVTFTSEAIEDLAIASAPLQARSGSAQVVVPLAAVFYDSKGAAWVYVVKTPGVYLRAPIAVEGMSGQEAYASSAPAVGTQVVVVGATEIYGAETGIGAK